MLLLLHSTSSCVRDMEKIEINCENVIGGNENEMYEKCKHLLILNKSPQVQCMYMCFYCF